MTIETMKELLQRVIENPGTDVGSISIEEARLCGTLYMLSPEFIDLWEAVDVLCNPPKDCPAVDFIQMAEVFGRLNKLNAKASTLT